MAQQRTSFELSTSARDDGTLEAVYIRFSNNPVCKTEEVKQDVLMVDYDRFGEIIGIEILAPVRLANLARLVDRDRRQPFRRFVEHSAPQEFVTV